jgi:hypothetical protein
MAEKERKNINAQVSVACATLIPMLLFFLFDWINNNKKEKCAKSTYQERPLAQGQG